MTSLRELIRPLTTTRGVILSALGVLTAVIAFIVRFRDSFYLIAIAGAVLAGLAIFVVLCWVAFARSESRLYGGRPHYRFGKYHIAGKVGMIGLIAAAALLVIRRDTRDMAANVIFDPRAATFTAGRVAIAQLLIAESPTESSLDVTFNNTLDYPVLIKNVAITASYDDGWRCCCPESSTFVIRDKVRVEQKGKKSALAGSIHLADDPKHVYPVSGVLFRDNCSAASLQLSFDTAHVIPQRTYDPVRFIIPRKLDAKETRDGRDLGEITIGDFENVLVSCTLDGQQLTIDARVNKPRPSRYAIPRSKN